MASDPRFAAFSQLLSTTTMGLAIPSFKEEFGDGKRIDFIGTLSHSFISDHVDDVKFPGINIDKNGVAKLSINVGA